MNFISSAARAAVAVLAVHTRLSDEMTHLWRQPGTSPPPLLLEQSKWKQSRLLIVELSCQFILCVFDEISRVVVGRLSFIIFVQGRFYFFAESLISGMFVIHNLIRYRTFMFDLSVL